jgi:hypothetical protein
MRQFKHFLVKTPKPRKKNNTNQKEEYETLDKDGNKITNTQIARNHIAQYFEIPHQAREGKEPTMDRKHYRNNRKNKPRW